MNYQAPSLRPRRSVSTVALRYLMEQQQKIEIGQRIRERRENSAETNRSIADYCDVSVEAVRNWIAGKGIAYDNAEKVAKLFGVDFDWLWRGEEKGSTPDVMGTLSPNGSKQLDRIERLVGDLSQAVAELGADVGKLQKSQEQRKRRAS